MDRELVWVEKERFQGWVCSVCGWQFKGLGPLVGNTIEEMKRGFERDATKHSELTYALGIRSGLRTKPEATCQCGRTKICQ